MAAKRIAFPKFHFKQTELAMALGGWNSGARHVWRCGRRFGKTTELEVIGANRAIHGKSVGWFSPNYKLLLPSYKRILKMLRPIVAHASKTDGIIELTTGGKIEFWTLNDEDAGRSRSYDLVIIDEAGLIQSGLKDIWQQAISPTLLDRRGDAIMAGTPKGINPENFFYEACTNKALGWTESHMPTSANPTLDQIGVANLVNEHPPLVYQQEFLAEFVDWSGAAFFALESLLIDGVGCDLPLHVDCVFATIDTAVKTGQQHDGTAVCFWAMSKHLGFPLVLLDWDIVQIEGALLESWLPTVFQLLQEYASKCKSRMGSIGAFIEDKASGSILLQQARIRGWPAQAIDSALTSVGKDERAISVSGYVYRHKVKMTQYAYDKTVNHKGQEQNHFVTQFCGYRVGVKDQMDDLLDAGCYGIAIALGDADGY